MACPLFSDYTEAGKLRTMKHLARGLAERPEVYGVQGQTLAELQRLVSELEAAIARTQDIETRTRRDFTRKQQLLGEAAKFCRKVAAFIRANPAVSDADRSALGLAPPPERKPKDPPTTTPMLTIAGIIPGGHELELFDSADAGRRGKPEIATGLELYVAYSQNGGRTPGFEDLLKTARPHGVLTRGKSKVIHADEEVGNVANYIGRWVNRRGAGPWSQPVRMLLALPQEKSRRKVA